MADPVAQIEIHSIPEWNDHWNCWEVGRNGDSLVLIMDFLFTSAVVTATQDWWFDDRWCYRNHAAAETAAQAWLRDGGGRSRKAGTGTPRQGADDPTATPSGNTSTPKENT